MNLGQLHKDKDLWGEHALEFRPERWESLDPKIKYQPFFAGPRKYHAQQMLVTQYRYLLVRMAIMFERIDNKDEVLELIAEHNIAITSRNGVLIAASAILPYLIATTKVFSKFGALEERSYHEIIQLRILKIFRVKKKAVRELRQCD